MRLSIFSAITGALVLGALLAIPLMADGPYTQADRSWITLNGTVTAVQPNTFTLDYGEGFVTVEMDDGDRDADAYKLMLGDEVTVTGRIDDDFFDSTTIEASAVYVEKLGTHFYSSAADEEDFFATPATVLGDSQTVVEGTVTDVNSEEFSLNTALRRIRVEVEEMPYNPLDKEGYQRIEVGDRVRVTGTMDADLFEGRELVADSVVTVRSNDLS